jgi:acyl carrier protein
MNDKAQIIENINNIIAGQLGVEPEEIRVSDHFIEDLYGTIQEVSSVALALEHEYESEQLEFTPEEITELGTVGQLYELVLDKLGVFA